MAGLVLVNFIVGSVVGGIGAYVAISLGWPLWVAIVVPTIATVFISLSLGVAFALWKSGFGYKGRVW